MITSTIMIDISDYQEKYIGGKVVTFYTINVYDNFSRKKWILSKRYSEFESLHKNLSKLISNVPSIPGKTFFQKKSADFLTKRKNHLESFLYQCVNRKDIMATEYLKDFLDLGSHAPNLTFNSPKVQNELTGLPLGIRDFYYYQEENIVFIACSDMNIASRVDAYITNANFPWEKKDSHITVGALLAYKLNFHKNASDTFEQKWTISFPIQTGIINFNIEKSILMAGLDNGQIFLYQTGIENKFSTYEILFQGKPHNNRVMGIDIEPKKNVVYSCSSDKKFVMTNLYDSNQIVIESIQAGFTSLFYDRINERIFLTNEIGQVYIYLTNQDIPVNVNIVQTHTKNVLRGLEVSLKNYYIFTSSMKGDISVLDLGNIGKEKYINEVSYFGAESQLRIIRYNEENSELLTGDQIGRITVWSLKEGKSIYTWKAHDGAITQMFYDTAHKILISGGKDRKLVFWELPEKWINADIEKFEKEEIKNLNDTMAMLKLQKALAKKDDDLSSDDDSLDGWDIRP